MYNLILLIFLFTYCSSAEEIKPVDYHYNFGYGFGFSSVGLGMGAFLNISDENYILSARLSRSSGFESLSRQKNKRLSDFSILFGKKHIFKHFTLTYSAGLAYFVFVDKNELSLSPFVIPIFFKLQNIEDKINYGISIPFEIQILKPKENFFNFGLYIYGNINQYNSLGGILLQYQMGN